MNEFIFDYARDEALVDSFLDTAALAHGHARKTPDWFAWKFRGNPFGEAVLACAQDGGLLVGCVAVGMQPFRHGARVVSAGLSFETFVHPDHQGKGIFGRLIRLAEQECAARGLAFILNFPNSQSYPGFVKSGWKPVGTIEYCVQVRNLFRVGLHIRDLRQPFTPGPPNLGAVAAVAVAPPPLRPHAGEIRALIDAEYIRWRFQTFPVAQYVIVDDEAVVSVARVGRRGHLSEVQVLMAERRNSHLLDAGLYGKYRQAVGFDLISFPSSRNNFDRRLVMGRTSFPLPSRVRATYRALQPDLDLDMQDLVISAVNFHTY